MIVFCWIIGIILCIISIVWSILPWLPWPQLAYGAIILAQILLNNPFSWSFIILWWITIIVLQLLDYYLPILWTKKFWWSKWWNYGCIIWMIVWAFFGAFGIIAFPFVWAMIWELIYKNNIPLAIKSAFWSFLWLAWWVVLKILISVILFVYFCIWCYSVS